MKEEKKSPCSVDDNELRFPVFMAAPLRCAELVIKDLPKYIDLCPNCHAAAIYSGIGFYWCKMCQEPSNKPLTILRTDWDKYPYPKYPPEQKEPVGYF